MVMQSQIKKLLAERQEMWQRIQKIPSISMSVQKNEEDEKAESFSDQIKISPNCPESQVDLLLQQKQYRADKVIIDIYIDF